MNDVHIPDDAAHYYAAQLGKLERGDVMGVHPSTIRHMRSRGFVAGHELTDRGRRALEEARRRVVVLDSSGEAWGV